MQPLISTTDLDREIGPLDEAEVRRADAYVTEASDLAREIGRRPWDLDAYPPPASVLLIVKSAVRRAMQEDPDGFSRESVGDWSGTKSRTDLDQTGVYFTPREETRLRVAAGRPTGVLSIRTPSAFDGRERPAPWWYAHPDDL